MGEPQVTKLAAVTHMSQEVYDDAVELQAHMTRWMNATPEQRDEWAREAEEQRREERRISGEPVELTLDNLLDKLRFSREYAEHLVQPYCTCEDGMDGWETCAHARDLGLRS